MFAFVNWKSICLRSVFVLLSLVGLARCDFVNLEKPCLIPERISKADQEYLKNLSKETWACLDYLVDKSTQLPYDNIQKGEYTSVTNIGLYVAALVAAVEMKFIPYTEAQTRLEVLLANMDEFWKWNGFTQSWNSVKTGRPADHDPWISTLDSGNFYAGLKVGRAYFPKLKDAFSKLIDPVAWDKMSNPKNHKLSFGYNRKEQKLGSDLNILGGDPRLAYFLAISAGKIPASTWMDLDRSLEMRYSMQYLSPGWQGGGLFMQYISGLLINERNSYLGLSAANFAYAQILHARNNHYPAWGWSACAAPTGEYLGMNALKDEVVTPHASVLAICHYPSTVIANLKQLDALGARKPFESNGKKYNFGYRDSINIKTKAVSNNYLLLDQAMLFLSLANFLENGVVWRTFAKEPDVMNGYQVLADFHPTSHWVKNPTTGKKIDVFELRDTDLTHDTDAFADLGDENVTVKNYVERRVKDATAFFCATPPKLDGSLKDWNKTSPIILPEDTIIQKNALPKGKCYFMWDKEYLYFAAEVVDTDLVFTQSRAEIWKDDVIELFLSARPDSFAWGQPESFQIGLAASGPEDKPQVWSWFQEEPVGNNVELASQMGDIVDGKPGYILEARIKWSFLKIQPSSGFSIGASPAIHFVDKERKQDLKLEWSYLPDGKSLGRLMLQ